ncbi:MAG TPA: glycosyltransferase family 39 protein [Chitinophagaceae bacterium]|nr:glycosyltransferase family 39 protein [Chitinophagaceae bacterium]
MYNPGRLRKILILLTLLKIVIPYFLQNSFYEPHRDEFLYLAEGHHLASGFMEVPPMLSVFAWLTHVFGDGMFWIKLWPSLFGAATFFIAGEIVISLGGKPFALLLLLLPFIFGVYLRLFFLFQPNTPEVFFWTLIAYSTVRFVQTKKNKFLYLLGVSIGLDAQQIFRVNFCC